MPCNSVGASGNLRADRASIQVHAVEGSYRVDADPVDRVLHNVAHDVNQYVGPHEQAGLLLELANESLPRRLTEGQAAAGQPPTTTAGGAYQQNTAPIYE